MISVVLAILSSPFPSSPVDMLSYELCCDMIDVVIDVSCIYGWVGVVSSRQLLFNDSDDVETCAYDQQSTSIIKLSNGVILYLREVNRSVVLFS